MMLDRTKRLLISFVVLTFSLAVVACDKDGITIEFESVDENEAFGSSCFIAVFGDIQYYTMTAQSTMLYLHSLAWIQARANEGWQFNCILHTGDITQNNIVNQWDYFRQATAPVAERIPYVSMIGDHDYTWEGQFITSRESTRFNDYVQFSNVKSKIVASFENGRFENIVVENSVYGQRLDLLVLEFGPRPEVVEWANEWVSSHPDINYILMNHEYLEKGGGRRTTGLKCAARLRNCTTFVTPDELWDNLIKCNDNIRLVLCGHVGGLYAITVDTNDFGREIPQIQHNIQSEEYRYDNWLMLWEFPAQEDSASIFIFNTRTGKYFNNQRCLSKFKYRDS